MDRRPEYLPAAVWRFYRELDEKRDPASGESLLNQRDRALIAHLFAPDMERTWRNFARHIDGPDVDLLPSAGLPSNWHATRKATPSRQAAGLN